MLIDSVRLRDAVHASLDEGRAVLDEGALPDSDFWQMQGMVLAYRDVLSEIAAIESRARALQAATVDAVATPVSEVAA